MKIKYKGQEIAFIQSEVIESVDNLTKQFSVIIENDLSIEMGEWVEIYSGSGKILIKGIIEYIDVGVNDVVTIGGRNASASLVKSECDNPVMFNERSSLNEIIGTIIQPFGLKCFGSASMPDNLKVGISLGENLAGYVAGVALLAGKFLYNDAFGNIHIQKKHAETGLKFALGENIGKRSITMRSDNIPSVYKVYSQNIGKKQGEPNIGEAESAGNSKRKIIETKVSFTEPNISIPNCKNIAKAYMKRLDESAILYKAEIYDTDLAELNKVYLVDDSFLKFENHKMAIMKIQWSHSHTGEKVKVTMGGKLV